MPWPAPGERGSTSSTSTVTDVRVVVGRIARAHGVRGEVAVEVRCIPGGAIRRCGVTQDVNILRGHVALQQQEAFFAGCRVLDHVGDEHGVAGKAALDEDITDGDFVEGNRFQLALQRIGAGVGEHVVHVLAKRRIALVTPCREAQALAVSIVEGDVA